MASFGIDVKLLDKEIKGTGTTIFSTAPNCDGPQLLVQGNEVLNEKIIFKLFVLQINGIGRILNNYGVPKKFIKGLELGLKESKKKKR